MVRKLFFIVIVISFLLVGCQRNSLTPINVDGSRDLANITPLPPIEIKQENIPTAIQIEYVEIVPTEIPPTPEPSATQVILPEISVSPPTPTSIPVPQAYGPGEFPPGINPLTGLPVSDPASLQIPPALVSVTNFPVTARPQAGLDFSPYVFELYIGEGMSRFLVLFYGDYPSSNPRPENGSGIQELHASGNLSEIPPSSMPADSAVIGPIRSGRLPYESARMLYNGFLVMASAFSGVSKNLDAYSNVYGSDAGDINSALIKVTNLEKLAQANVQRLGGAAMNVTRFDPTPPIGGKPAQSLWFMYSYLNQIFWRYDPASGAYNRYQNSDVTPEGFVEATDRLNEQPLTYENVVILFTNHRMCTETAFDLDLLYVKRAPALLFRDGQVYDIYWTTKNEDYERTTGRLRPIRFVDAEGNAFPMKPGQTWVHFVPMYTRYWETVDSEVLYDLQNKDQPGSGFWAMRFYPSMFIFDQSVCDRIKG